MKLSPRNLTAQLLRTLIFLVAVSLCAVSTVGCGDGGGSGCVDDYDCPEAQICVGETNENGDLVGSGGCEPFVCASDEDCVEPGVACEQNVCIPASGQ